MPKTKSVGRPRKEKRWEKLNLSIAKDSKKKVSKLADEAHQSITGFVETMIDEAWGRRELALKGAQ